MKNEVHLFHEMQEISINLPIIFQILSPKEELFLVKNNEIIYWEKIPIREKLAILFAGVVKYYCQVVLGGVETFPENA